MSPDTEAAIVRDLASKAAQDGIRAVLATARLGPTVDAQIQILVKANLNMFTSFMASRMAMGGMDENVLAEVMEGVTEAIKNSRTLTEEALARGLTDEQVSRMADILKP